MIYDAIKNFNRQFEYEPEIENGKAPSCFDKLIVAGMGGSHLAADLLRVWNPRLDVAIHHDYGLPDLPDGILRKSLLVANCYSGNTEETIDVLESALKKGIGAVAVSVGGRLLELAKKNNLPFVRMPDTGIQPRMAIGYNFKALLRIMGEERALKEVSELAGLLKPLEYETAGKELAGKLKGYVPVIYSSGRNKALAYNWKIKFNETGKIPAFCNTFPELNHNEMTGFNVKEETRSLSDKFYFIFLKDKDDSSRIVKRMKITEQLYKNRGLSVESVALSGKNTFHKIFASLVLADWTAYCLAKNYGVEPEQVPMVEEFKKLIA